MAVAVAVAVAVARWWSQLSPHVCQPNSFWLCQMAQWLDNAQLRFGYQWQCKIHRIHLNSLMIIGIKQRHSRTHEPAIQPQPHILNIVQSETTHFGWQLSNLCHLPCLWGCTPVFVLQGCCQLSLVFPRLGLEADL